MVSPVAHTFAGFWTFLLFAERTKIRLRDEWRRYAGYLCLLVFVAKLADLDFIPELLFQKDYHRGFSHSLLAAICLVSSGLDLENHGHFLVEHSHLLRCLRVASRYRFLHRYALRLES